jgi:hypothetical protein
MEALIAGLGIAAGAGWGVAGGLLVALLVALRVAPRFPRPPANSAEVLPLQEQEAWNQFGQRRA